MVEEFRSTFSSKFVLTHLRPSSPIYAESRPIWSVRGLSVVIGIWWVGKGFRKWPLEVFGYSGLPPSAENRHLTVTVRCCHNSNVVVKLLTFTFFLHKLCWTGRHSNFICEIKVGVISCKMMSFQDSKSL